MLLNYFYDKKVAHASYMVGCQATGEALIVDPGRDVDQYLETAAAEGMRIVAAAETHIHADFVSGARELAHRVGATLYLSDEGDADWKYQYLDDPGLRYVLVKDGDTFRVGNVELTVVHTPGHTPEHISFLLTDWGGGADQPMGIFTGDCVFVGSIGRPDLLEKAAGIGNTAVPGAIAQFASVQRFKALPDFLQVWPAHGAGSACGKGLGAIPSSTVGYEKRFSPALAHEAEGPFVEDLLSDQPEPPRYFAIMKRVNKVGPRILNGIRAPEQLSAERLPQLIADGHMVLDLRDTAAFADQHIPGTINVPLDQLSVWAGWFVNYDRPLYLIVPAQEARTAVRDLAYIGIDRVEGFVDVTAVDQLATQGVAAPAYETLTPAQAAAGVLNGDYLVVDVRGATEWEAGRLPNAHHVMLGYLHERAAELINGKPILVNCQAGGRSAIGASILKAHGARRVINLAGGLRDWAAAGLPVVR